MNAMYGWSFMAAVVLFSSVGDVFLAKGMSSIGDLSELRRRDGLGAVMKAVFRNGYFLLGVLGMALAYFSMLAALSWTDLSLAAPATASLTFVLTAILAKIFLKENVDKRRWIAVVLVCVGVVLLAH
jgi:drug/metabolite transporter (DMT)-like permease